MQTLSSTKSEFLLSVYYLYSIVFRRFNKFFRLLQYVEIYLLYIQYYNVYIIYLLYIQYYLILIKQSFIQSYK